MNLEQSGLETQLPNFHWQFRLGCVVVDPSHSLQAIYPSITIRTGCEEVTMMFGLLATLNMDMTLGCTVTIDSTTPTPTPGVGELSSTENCSPVAGT